MHRVDEIHSHQDYWNDDNKNWLSTITTSPSDLKQGIHLFLHNMDDKVDRKHLLLDANDTRWLIYQLTERLEWLQSKEKGTTSNG